VFSLYPHSEKFSHQLHILLRTTAADDGHLQAVAELAAEHGNAVYAEMLMLITGKHFGEDTAKSYWDAAINHSRKIFLPEYAATGFRAALLDYLLNVAGEFSDPRLIEADYLRNITRSSITDGLTGLYNQTYFKKVLESSILKQRRSNDQSFALVLLDLDHFKQYNDRCGHLAGDEALRQCAAIITNAMRDGDVAARYGGEEFALLLPNLDRHDAFIVAERIRRNIEKHLFARQELLDSGNLTISGGVALFPDSGESVADMINAADKELYKAKERRNCIYSFSEDRRQRTRKQVRSLVEYASFEGALYRPALSIDISEEGMGIGCDSMMFEGMTLSLRLTKPYWPENVHLKAIVRQVRQREDMVYVGLEFEKSLESIKELLHHNRPAAPPAAA
jgi:diguanylate cyclase (GGDEF)-like protein